MSTTLIPQVTITWPTCLPASECLVLRKVASQWYLRCKRKLSEEWTKLFWLNSQLSLLSGNLKLYCWEELNKRKPKSLKASIIHKLVVKNQWLSWRLISTKDYKRWSMVWMELWESKGFLSLTMMTTSAMWATRRLRAIQVNLINSNSRI